MQADHLLKTSRTASSLSATARRNTAENYRQRLIEEIVREHPQAWQARAAIKDAVQVLRDPEERIHAALHEVRYLATFAMVPPGPGTLVDIGASEVYSAPLRSLKSWTIEPVPVLSMDYETDRLPFADASVDGVLLCEVLEHFTRDPLHCLIEINRILKQGGFLVLTTPNAVSWYAIHRALRHEHPSRWAFYSLDPVKGRNHIHVREYSVAEVEVLLHAAGFDSGCSITKDYGIAPRLQPIAGYSARHRGETIYSRVYKAGAPRKRSVNPPYLTDQAFDGR
jgi:SAM-dependent methyltransferase